jgi:Transposase DDE domain group 1
MVENTLLPFSLPSVRRMTVTAAFDGGRIISDGGVLLLSAIDTKIGVAVRLAPLINDPRNPLLVTHSVADILRACILDISRGSEDTDDLDHLHADSGFKLAC